MHQAADSLLFKIIRPLFLFGVRTKPVLDALDAQKDERILDAGCGYGYFVDRFKHCRYTGVDLDPRRIEEAKAKFGENASRRFMAADIRHTGLPSKSFDKALVFGLLHHVPDDVAGECIRELSRLVKGRIVFLDVVYSKYNFINNILCRLDQGKFARTGPEYLALCPPQTPSVSHRYYHARSGIAKYFLMTCEAKPA